MQKLFPKVALFMFTFAQPYWLILLLMIVPMVYRYKNKKVHIHFSRGRRLKALAKSPMMNLKHLGFICRVAALILFILAMARPQTGQTTIKHRSEGLDMMLVIDTSGSMQGMDFIIDGQRQDRLQIAKSVLKDFIAERSDDRLGLTIFGTNAYSYVPLTLDHDVLATYLDEVEIGMAGESTAIGDAIGIATNRLKDLEAKSKVMILLTDGENKAGKIEPLEAANAAKAMGVKIYTIGIGSNGPVPVKTPFGYQNVVIELDEDLLKNISQMTHGQYFKATDTETLSKVYQTIDQLEKTEVETDIQRLYDENFAVFLWPGLFLVCLELLFGLSKWRRIP